MYAWSLSCVWPCNLMDCSPPGSSVRGIIQARILEWVAMPASRGSSWPRIKPWSPVSLLHWQADSLPLHHLRSRYAIHVYSEFLLSANMFIVRCQEEEWDHHPVGSSESMILKHQQRGRKIEHLGCEKTSWTRSKTPDPGLSSSRPNPFPQMARFRFSSCSGIGVQVLQKESL